MNLVAKKSRFPFTSFPNCWYRVAYSKEIKSGEVKPLYYFGKDLVLFRTEKGIPYVFDAHCLHLGAHLGHGGKVKGENIQCPFHGWRYDSNGKCTYIPYSNNLPPNAQIRKWPTREVNGVIIVYYHSEGAPPTWEIPDVSEYTGGVQFHKAKQWKLRTHPQDLAENALDMAHFVNVHPSKNIISAPKLDNIEINGPVTTLQISTGFKIPSTASWLLGKEMVGLYTNRLYGVSCFFALGSVEGKRGFQTASITWSTPIDEEYCDVHLTFGIPSFFKNPLGYFTTVTSRQEGIKFFEQDFPVVENKIYRSTALLCDEEAQITKLRHWSSQFYPESASPITNYLNSKVS